MPVDVARHPPVVATAAHDGGARPPPPRLSPSPPPNPVLLRVVLPPAARRHTGTSVEDISARLRELDALYLQRAAEKGLHREARWTKEHVLGVQWGGDDSLIFQLDTHITRQRVLHRMYTLRDDTDLLAKALLSATESAARSALQAACRAAGLWHKMLGACMLLLPADAASTRGLHVRLADP